MNSKLIEEVGYTGRQSQESKLDTILPQITYRQRFQFPSFLHRDFTCANDSILKLNIEKYIEKYKFFFFY